MTSPTQLLHGKSRFTDVLFRVSSDPKFTEDALVDLLMRMLGDETYCRPPATQGCESRECDLCLLFQGLAFAELGMTCQPSVLVVMWRCALRRDTCYAFDARSVGVRNA